MGTSSIARKRSVFLLREGLYALGFGVASLHALQAAVAGAPAASSSSAYHDSFWADVLRSRAQLPSCLPVAWEVYLSLFEAIEDFPVHLIDEVWRAISCSGVVCVCAFECCSEVHGHIR